eukprot:TRINITY_DN6878_c3_g1_i1.p1 TRINITY_DN6878_c3_g1~~TRINITY_DN6878_c3_g1_i1.p1  ORF type:complete len:583 (+),score=119.95 TRINITY_DN6878_c3_g1_i1:47-1795(+)
MERYKIQKKIGKGSYGSVFRVLDKEQNKEVVLKRIPLVDLSERERAQAKLEVQLMQRLIHPCLTYYWDSFLYNGEDMCIVMRFYRGGDLSKMIYDKQGSQYFSEDQILFIVSQILLALQYMHVRRVLHRDVKAQNIFILEDGCVALGDLGIAKVLDKSQDMASTSIGTPMYMSPEVCNGDPYSFSSDIWAAGCVAYELANLKHAFESKDLNSLVMKILRASYPPVNKRYSKNFIALINKMLNKHANKRPTADAILQTPMVRKHASKVYEVLCKRNEEEESEERAILQEQLVSLGILKNKETKPVDKSDGSLKGEMEALQVSHEMMVETEILIAQLKEDVDSGRKQISRQIDDALQVQRKGSDQQPPAVGSDSSNMSAKDRVLRKKSERLAREEADRLAALERARVKSVGERVEARQAEFNQYHKGASPRLSKPSMYQPAQNDEGDVDGMIDKLEQQVASYRKQIGECVGRIHKLSEDQGLPQQTELLSPGLIADDEEELESESETVFHIESRTSALHNSLEQALTKPVFDKAYSLIKNASPTDDPTTSKSFISSLEAIIPPESLHLWKDIDQLLFMEASLGG